MNQENSLEEEEKLILDDIASRLKAFGREREQLIPILQMIQERHSYIAEDAIKMAAEHLSIAICEVYGVATFYNQFRFHPPGKNQIKVCLGTACHVRGGERVRERIVDTLNLNGKATTEDMRFTLEGVRCIGCCSLGPVIKVNEDVHGRIGADEVKKVLEKYE